jgi:hypothetical protein
MLGFTRKLISTRQGRRSVIVAGIGTLLLSLVAVGFISAANAPSADQVDIQQVCLHAVTADQTLAVRVSSPGVTIKAQSVEATDTSPVTQDQVQGMKDHAAKVYGQYFTGALLANKVAQMNAAIDHYSKSDVRYFGGGVDWMTFSAVTVQGSTATATARARIWAKMAQDQGHGKLVYATPHNEVDYTYTLVSVNGHWLITGETWSFAPGSEP